MVKRRLLPVSHSVEAVASYRLPDAGLFNSLLPSHWSLEKSNSITKTLFAVNHFYNSIARTHGYQSLVVCKIKQQSKCMRSGESFLMIIATKYSNSRNCKPR